MIKDFAFSHCQGLKEVEFPEGLTEIGTMAFYQCSSLKRVDLPRSLKKLGNNVQKELFHLKKYYFLSLLLFSYFVLVPLNKNSPLKHLFLDNKVKKGKLSVLKKDKKNENCVKLLKVELPKGMKFIERAVFRRCKRLKEIRFSEQIVIKDFAFSHCQGLLYQEESPVPLLHF